MKETPSTPAKEHLTVKNFLVIKEADFEVKRFNIVMGEQATGKSLIAKLLYFFRESLFTIDEVEFLLRLAGETDYRDYFVRTATERFFAYFPYETWKDIKFDISYQWKDVSISIESKEKKAPGLTIDVTKPFEELLAKFHELAKKEFARSGTEGLSLLSLTYSSSIDDTYATFIPASRSLLALIKQDATLFMGSGFSDPFMRSFGTTYNFSKYRRELFNRELFNDEGQETSFQKEIISKVLSGSYTRKDKKEYIEMPHGLVPIINASSGQQEALPMLMVLTNSPPSQTFIAEEPEAHLFPNAQRYVMQLMGTVYNKGSTLFLTTHSPYILVALNNLIMAANVTDEKRRKKGVAAKVAEIIPKECQVRYEDVGAYTIKDGRLVSAMDEDEKLINAKLIDHASDVLNDEFDQLLTLRGA